jgi:hypothetical protein
MYFNSRNATSNSPRFVYSSGHYLFILRYWGGNGGTVHKIKDDSKIIRLTNLDRRGQRSIPITSHLLDARPSHSFTLPTTFKN